MVKSLLALILLSFCSASNALCDVERGVRVKTGGNGSAMWATYWCPPASKWMDYTPDGGWLSLSASPELQGKVAAALASGKTSDLRSLITSTAPPTGFNAQLLATRPAAPVVVSKNGTTATRPAYVVIASTGKRAGTAFDSVRAPVGARAACGLMMIADGSSTYCAWEEPDGRQRPNLVTLVSEVK